MKKMPSFGTVLTYLAMILGVVTTTLVVMHFVFR